MTFKTPDELSPLVDSLFASDDASALTNQAARALEECRDLLHGFAMAAQRMGMEDVYGLLRGSIAEDDDPEAQKMRKALDMLSEMGVGTSEPDLDSLFEHSGAS